jgi:fructose-bisphosphate aldolase class II
MPFVGLPEILNPCIRQPWAVGGFDTINLEITQAILTAAEAEQSPVILMLLPSHTPMAEMPGLVGAIRAEAEKVTVPVGLLLDHAVSLQQVVTGIRLGCSAIMFDASSKPLAENIAATRQVVEIAHAAGVSVEAELGHVGGGDESGVGASLESVLTNVDDAAHFVDKTGVDALAVSIGSAHGPYIKKPVLDFQRLERIRASLDVPLVLHGGSGIPDKDMGRLISLGIDKINVWTDISLAYMAAARGKLIEADRRYPLHDVLHAARRAATEVVRERMQLFGSSGKV